MVLKWDDAVTAARHCRGLQPGKQVTVLDEVDFAEYSARDQGTPNRKEAFKMRKLSTDTVEVPVRHLRLSHADELTESPERSVSRQRKAPPPEEENYASDWMDLARTSCRGPRRSRSDSSGRRGSQVPDDTNLQPGVAALRDMLGMVRSGYRPADAAQQPTETGWSILSSTAPYSSLSMLATPWKTRRHEDQLDTPSTVATDSPIDMIWSPRRRWVCEGPAQLVTELPGDSAVSELSRSLQGSVGVKAINLPRTTPLPGSGELEIAVVLDWPDCDSGWKDITDHMSHAADITVDTEPAGVSREDEAESAEAGAHQYAACGRDVRNFQRQFGHFEALRLLEAQHPEQFFGEMPAIEPEVEEAVQAASTAADPEPTAGDAEDEVPMDGGEPQTGESEEVGSDSPGSVAAEAASAAWNPEPYADQGEDEAEVDDGEAKSNVLVAPESVRGIVTRCTELAVQAASTAADPEPTAGDAEDEVPMDGGEPQTAESEEVGSDSPGLVAAEAARTSADPEPAAREDEVLMEEVDSHFAGFIAPEVATAAADPERAACGEDEAWESLEQPSMSHAATVSGSKVEEDNDFDEMEVESQQLSSDSFRASPSPDEAALKDQSSSEAGLEDYARSESSDSAPRSRRGPTQSPQVEEAAGLVRDPTRLATPGQRLQEECSSTTWCSQNSGPAGPSSHVWQDASERSSGSFAARSNSSSEAQDHPEVFTAQALGWPREEEEAAAFVAGHLQDEVNLHSLPRSASGTHRRRAEPAAWLSMADVRKDEASPDRSGRSLPRSHSSRSKQEAAQGSVMGD
ncbi:unnamed protein product, partial [Symbiodinium microadriaticum]